ncbi:MAG: DNA-processing protein DprA [Methylacidiphilales bacterium]|nr:DNA-processing protein DprA [Candidatus Methylacidiphilales bacterium]
MTIATVNNLTIPPYKIISTQDTEYPLNNSDTFTKNALNQLYYLGNLSLLRKSKIGFCGSRHASKKGLETAKDCAEQSAKRGIVVVSGYASGVDLVAHTTSLTFGGSTILVLPEGIANFTIKKQLQNVWDWERVLVISQFKPEDFWQPFRAFTRNKTIIALSSVMVVIEAGDKGGTLHAGLETLKANKKLFVAYYQDKTKSNEGNATLISQGGVKLCKSRTTLKANLVDAFSYCNIISAGTSDLIS